MSIPRGLVVAAALVVGVSTAFWIVAMRDNRQAIHADTIAASPVSRLADVRQPPDLGSGQGVLPATQNSGPLKKAISERGGATPAPDAAARLSAANQSMVAGDYARAMESLKSILGASTNLAILIPATIRYVSSARMVGRLDQVLGELGTDLLKQLPHRDRLGLLALAAEAGSKDEPAISRRAELLRLDPSDTENALALARLLAKGDKTEEAVKALSTAASSNPSDRHVLDLQGAILLVRAGQQDAAHDRLMSVARGSADERILVQAADLARRINYGAAATLALRRIVDTAASGERKQWAWVCLAEMEEIDCRAPENAKYLGELTQSGASTRVRETARRLMNTPRGEKP